MELGFYTISKSAKILKVTDKTIRNYIDKKILRAEKWNGSWRISEKNLLEIFEKKFGKRNPVELFREAPENDSIRLSSKDFADLQKKIGQSEADFKYVQELKQDLKTIGERVIQLEASAASGWTEARTAKQDLSKTRDYLKAAQEHEIQNHEEINWLRREMDRLKSDLHESNILIKTLERQNSILAQRTYERAIMKD